MSEEKKMTVGDRIRSRSASRKAVLANLGIKDLRQAKPKPQAKQVVLVRNPKGLLIEMTKIAYLERKKEPLGDAWRLATKKEKKDYLALTAALNETRSQETADYATQSEDGEYKGQVRRSPQLIQSATDADGILLAEMYVADAELPWRTQAQKGMINLGSMLDEDDEEDKDDNKD